MNYRKELLNKIEKLLNGSLTVPEFEKDYYLFYINEVPDNALTDAERYVFWTNSGKN